MPGASNPRLTARTNTECIRTLTDECNAHLVICDNDARAVDARWPQLRPTGRRATDHYNRGGLLGLAPASLGLVVVTLDPHAGSRAADMVHDAMVEDPMPGEDQELQLYYRAGPDAPAHPARWRHGRILHGGCYVVLRNVRRLVEGIAHGGRSRAVEVGRLPQALHRAGATPAPRAP